MKSNENEPETTTVSRPELPNYDHEPMAADHDEPWQFQPYHLSDRAKLYLLKHRDRLIASEREAA